MGEKFVPGGPERYRHQKLGLRKMLETKGVTALLFDPGLGKTATTLDYCSLLALKSQTGEARVLVIAPLVAVDTWVQQSAKWVSPQVNYWAEALSGTVIQRAEALAARGDRPYLKEIAPKKGGNRHHIWKNVEVPRAMHHGKSIMIGSRPEVRPALGPDAVPGPRLVLEVLNIDTFGQRRQIGSKTAADVMLDAVKRFQPDLVVIDESHKIKSISSNVSRLMARISEHVDRRIILTGTVMPHSPLDVFAQWRFLQPYAFGTTDINGEKRKATMGAFKDRYTVLGGWMGKEVVSFQNIDEMQDIMAENAIVGKKEDALDLPATTDVELTVDLSPREKKAYLEMKKDLSIQMGTTTSTASNRLVQMMRLRQITSGHLADDNGQMVELGKSKVNTIASLVNDSLEGEKRVVVFALFRHEITMLDKALQKAGTTVMTITGNTPQAKRIEMRTRFGDAEDDRRYVMIAQIKTMSLAVNELVTASHAVFASMSQQRDDWIQARDRLNRIGQIRPVTFWNAVAPGTVDEVVLSAHRERTSLERAMLNHIHDAEPNHHLR